MTYFDELQAVISDVVSTLEERGIESRYLQFGGEGDIADRVWVPTDAQSEFLANRAMGDWAEETLAAAIARDTDLKAIPYGDADRMAAGEEGFREFYCARIEDVRCFGKRPDLLLFPQGAQVADLSQLSIVDSDPFARRADAAIEVRSSKFKALHYMTVRRADREAGNRVDRQAPSFTVKVEDLKIVYRWIERYRVPQSYFQVFFDSVFAINVVDIFRLVGEGSVKIDNPRKSQENATLMVPVTAGLQVGTFRTLPDFTAEHRETRLGRIDAYVRPVGGVTCPRFMYQPL